MVQKILFIPGIFNPKFFQNFWRAKAKERGFELIEFTNPFYSYWSIKKMKHMIKEGVNILTANQNKNIIIITHSFGGILVNCMLQELNNYKFQKLIMMASPLKMNIFGMKKRKNLLGYNQGLKYDAKVISYGGYFDFIVLFFWTNYNKEKHHNIFCEHLYFLFSKKLIQKILNKL